MSRAQGLDDHVALRIGLASRLVSHQVSLDTFVGILIRAVGRPITPQRLARLRLKRFKEAGRSAFADLADEELRSVLAALKDHQEARQAVIQALPSVQAYEPGDIPGSIRVACASNRGDRVDASFGSCERYLIYQVSAADVRLIDIRHQRPGSQSGDHSEQPTRLTREQKYRHRIRHIQDSHVVCAMTIGSPAAAQLVNAGLHPIKVGAPKSALEVMQDLQAALDQNPAPWLIKIMEASARDTWSRRESNQEEFHL